MGQGLNEALIAASSVASNRTESIEGLYAAARLAAAVWRAQRPLIIVHRCAHGRACAGFQRIAHRVSASGPEHLKQSLQQCVRTERIIGHLWSLQSIHHLAFWRPLSGRVVAMRVCSSLNAWLIREPLLIKRVPLLKAMAP